MKQTTKIFSTTRSVCGLNDKAEDSKPFDAGSSPARRIMKGTNMNQKVKVTVDPRDYFGEFVLPNQKVEVEGLFLGVEHNFMNSGDSYMFLSVPGRKDLMMINMKRCKEYQLIKEYGDEKGEN